MPTIHTRCIGGPFDGEWVEVENTWAMQHFVISPPSWALDAGSVEVGYQRIALPGGHEALQYTGAIWRPKPPAPPAPTRPSQEAHHARQAHRRHS